MVWSKLHAATTTTKTKIFKYWINYNNYHKFVTKINYYKKNLSWMFIGCYSLNRRNKSNHLGIRPFGPSGAPKDERTRPVKNCALSDVIALHKRTKFKGATLYGAWYGKPKFMKRGIVGWPFFFAKEATSRIYLNSILYSVSYYYGISSTSLCFP